jgi:hypothetical protein
MLPDDLYSFFEESSASRIRVDRNRPRQYFSIMKLPIRCNRATLLARAVVSAHMVFALLFSRIGFAQSDWKAEWDKIVRSAEAETQLTLYGCCYEYDRDFGRL